MVIHARWVFHGLRMKPFWESGWMWVIILCCKGSERRTHPDNGSRRALRDTRIFESQISKYCSCKNTTLLITSAWAKFKNSLLDQNVKRDESRPLGLKSHLGRRSRCTGEASLGRHLSNGKGRQACSGPRTKQGHSHRWCHAHCKYQIWETPSKRKYKGRLVFRGDQVRDSWGGSAQFGAMFSTPTNIQAII